mmetsp:Transcript_109/g.215  ORF Transcript_109/g.215 Transcript_109/m.215 type:complete len:249 (-) Transcript_109:586-1332(-)
MPSSSVRNRATAETALSPLAMGGRVESLPALTRRATAETSTSWLTMVGRGWKPTSARGRGWYLGTSTGAKICAPSLLCSGSTGTNMSPWDTTLTDAIRPSPREIGTSTGGGGGTSSLPESFPNTLAFLKAFLTFFAAPLKLLEWPRTPATFSHLLSSSASASTSSPMKSAGMGSRFFLFNSFTTAALLIIITALGRRLCFLADDFAFKTFRVTAAPSIARADGGFLISFLFEFPTNLLELDGEVVEAA